MKNIFNQKIIDTHHHLWDPTSNKYDWLIAPGHEIFNHVYLVDDYINDINALNIIKSIHVQAEINQSEAIYETEWLQNISNSDSSINTFNFPNAIIGFADFLDSDVEKILEQHLKTANFRGIRHILNFDKNNKDISHASIDYFKEETWLKNFSLLNKYNLSFDLSILFNQANDAAKLINNESNTLFIINHTLSPIDVSENNIEAWLFGIKLLSSFDNVVIKLSGFGEFNSKWTEETIRPLILNAIDNFGVDRSMFGSNFPVDKFLSSSGYFDYWNAYFNIVIDFTDNEKDKMFYQNAEKFYKI
jgi:predicted TIM-barrel fold metal-dependent hydrolase